MSDIVVPRIPRKPHLSKKDNEDPAKVKEYQKRCGEHAKKLADYHSWMSANQDLVKQRNDYSRYLFERRRAQKRSWRSTANHTHVKKIPTKTIATTDGVVTA
jgi:hypothetical protein